MAAGRQRDAERFLARLESLAPTCYVAPVHMAVAQLAIGHTGQAFEWIDKAVESRDVMVLYLRAMEIFEPIREDPRTAAILERVGLAEPGD